MNLDDLAIRGRESKNIWDFENSFFWFSHPTRLNKILAHYDLYKTIVDLPGDIFELGVYKAASLVRLATFRNLLENDSSRKIVGFDAFGKFPTTNLTLESDRRFIESFEEQGGEGLSREEVAAILRRKKFENIDLVQGNVFETLGNYLAEFPATRISLLHLDMDVKEPTEYALDLLYERVVPNGLIVFDDYATVAGETDAVDGFLKRHRLSISKPNNYFVPSFVRKPL